MSISNLEIYLSGGVANTDPNQSLGGVVSATQLGVAASISLNVGIAGITLVDVAGVDAPDGGSIYFNYSSAGVDTPYIQYMKPNGEFATSLDNVELPIDGRYVIPAPEGDAALVIDVVYATLPDNSFLSRTITFTNGVNNLFDDVLKAESTSGGDNYRHIYIKNADLVNPISCGLYISKNYQILETLALGIENITSSTGTNDTLLTDEFTAPVGVSFDSPKTIDEATPLLISASQYIGVFFRRKVAILSDVETPLTKSTLIISAL